MNNLDERVKRIKSDVLSLKSGSDTTGDSATAYQEIYALGDYPRDSYTNHYVWDFYFEPVSNVENFILTPITTECYGYYSDSYGTDFYSTFSRVSGCPDMNNPLHIIVILNYLPSDRYTVKGSNLLTVTANAPFILKSSEKRTITG